MKRISEAQASIFSYTASKKLNIFPLMLSLILYIFRYKAWTILCNILKLHYLVKQIVQELLTEMWSEKESLRQICTTEREKKKKNLQEKWYKP